MVRAMMPGVTTDTLTGLATDMSRVTGTSRATARGGRARGRRTTDRRDTMAFRSGFQKRRLEHLTRSLRQRGCCTCIQQLAAVPKRGDTKLPGVKNVRAILAQLT